MMQLVLAFLTRENPTVPHWFNSEAVELAPDASHLSCLRSKKCVRCGVYKVGAFVRRFATVAVSKPVPVVHHLRVRMSKCEQG